MDDIYTKKPEECAYSFTQHRACEFFPCHKTSHPEDFNCLFCYCPLYTLGSKCGTHGAGQEKPIRKETAHAVSFFVIHHYSSRSSWSPLSHT